MNPLSRAAGASRLVAALAALLSLSPFAAGAGPKATDAVPSGPAEVPALAPLPLSSLAPLDPSAQAAGAADAPVAASVSGLGPSALGPSVDRAASAGEAVAAPPAAGDAARAYSEDGAPASAAAAPSDEDAETSRAAAGILFENAGRRGAATLEDWNAFLGGMHYQFEEYMGVKSADLAPLLARSGLRPQELDGKRGDEIMAAIRRAAKTSATALIVDGARIAQDEGPRSPKLSAVAALLKTAARASKHEGIRAAAVKLDLLRYAASPAELRAQIQVLRDQAASPPEETVPAPAAMRALMRIPDNVWAAANGAYEARLRPGAEVSEFRLLARDGSGRVTIHQYSMSADLASLESEDWGRTWRHLDRAKKGAAADKPLAPLQLAAAAQAPAAATRAAAAPAPPGSAPRSFLSGLLPASWTLRKAGPKPAQLLQEASLGEGAKEAAVSEALGAILGLQFNAYSGGYHVYRLSGRGVPASGLPEDYHPDRSSYLVSPAAVALAELALSGAVEPKRLSWAASIFQGLADYDKSEPGDHARLLARLAELKARPTLTIDGKTYISVGRTDEGGEIPVRLAQASDWGPKPEINGNTWYESLAIEKGAFGDILASPTVWDGEGRTSYMRGRPTVEGSEVVVFSREGAVRGTFRGVWSPASTRGWPLSEQLRYKSDLKGVARLYFVETKSASGERVLVAVDGRDPELRLFSTARPRR